ncbi:putative reverse transcriptase domain-containing protein [Tanacetum coccineum]
MDSLNPPSPASESEPVDVIEVENTTEPEDETVPASVHEVGESSTVAIPREDSDSLLPGFMRRDIDSFFGRIASLSRWMCGREMAHALVEKKGKAKDKYYGKLILDLGNEVRSSMEQGMATMEKLVKKLGNAEDKVKCKELKKELEEANLSNTFLRMHNERVERDLYWTRVQAYEFYQEMIHRRFVFEERLNEAIDILVEDVESSSPKMSIIPPKSAPMTQAAIRRMIKESVDAAIAAERARQTNAKNDARGSGPVRGQDVAHTVCECTFAGFIKCNPIAFHEGKKVKFAAATLQGPTLTWWNAKVATMGLETVNQMPWTEIKQLMTAEFCPIEEVQRMEHELWNLKNNQKQGNARVMVTTPTDGKVSSGSLPLCEHCFTRHVGACTIKCHKCGKVRCKARYCKEKNVATGANALPIWTCYDCGKQGHTRNRCPKKVKQEEVKEACGRAYAIKDAEPSFVDTRFSSMLNIDPVKIGASYEVELADGRVVSMNTVLKGCTLNLVNHIFKIDLMPIELGMFDVIIGMDRLVKHDVVIICGEKVVRIPYENKMLIVESNKGVSRLKVISCIKAYKYVEQGYHLFLAYVTGKKSKEKRLEDVSVIRDFPEVFPKELPGLPPPRQVEF